jgi:uncharacterized protein
LFRPDPTLASLAGVGLAKGCAPRGVFIATMSESVDVRHNESAHRFEVSLDDGVAFSAYQRRGDVLRMYHTEVPPAAEGKGLAAQVVKAALRYAQSENLRVDPACSYVRRYMARHPDTHALLADGITL